MPVMSNTPKVSNDKSSLLDGWHPAFLLAIQEEDTPPSWKMAEKSPRMYRWKFAVWSHPDRIATENPERQSAPSSTTFSPKGKNPASKAYTWTAELLGRQIMPGESVDLDPLLPLPCRVKVSRNGEYANIMDVERWPEGAQALTPALKGLLAFLDTETADAVHAPQPQAQPATQAPAQATLPGTPAPTVRW